MPDIPDFHHLSSLSETAQVWEKENHVQAHEKDALQVGTCLPQMEAQFYPPFMNLFAAKRQSSLHCQKVFGQPRE